jgi:hypothetical protein
MRENYTTLKSLIPFILNVNQQTRRNLTKSVKVKFTLEHAMKAQRERRGIALLFL